MGSFRIYIATAIKWAKEHKLIVGGSGVSVVFLYFAYSFFIGALVLTGFSGNVICEGTEFDPCYVYINFTANADTFWYPFTYDPWGRDTFVDFDPAVKEWELQRSWGDSWRNIPLDKACTGTWCGGKPGVDALYSVAWREGRDYQTRVRVLKYNATDEIRVTLP